MNKLSEIPKIIERPICFFDLETTGTDVMQSRICAIAIMIIDSDGNVTKKARKINPGVKIPQEATDIHGITNKDVQGCPTFYQVAESLYKLIDGCHFGGYNSNRFDIPLLTREFERAGINNPFTGASFIDVFQIYCYFNKRNLEAAYKAYTGKILEKAHDPEADIEATVEIFENMLKAHRGDLKGKIQDISKIGRKFEPVDLFGKIIANEKRDKLFNFGRYKGHKVEYIIRNDPGYIAWILGNDDFPENTKGCIKMIKNTIQ